MENKKNNPIATDQGLQVHSTGINVKYDTPLFDTLAILDDSAGRDVDSNVAIPSELAVEQAKEWVDENRL
ncbi:MAG: DUF3787 domain-containing protein [Defluviitaleaceae bacterium]|nr:DUF3787 domain-containing protein [Defluviitaleaceae bacterium]